jgi:hypothetical protein
MKGQPYHNYIKLDDMECHARKGWRGMSRPAGTNRRRKLIPQAALMVPTSKAGHKQLSIWSKTRSWWSKTKAAYAEHRAAVTTARNAEIEAEIVAALLAAKAKAAT